MVGLDRTSSLKGPSCLAPMASHLALYLLNQQPALLTRTTHSLLLLAPIVPFLRTARRQQDQIRGSAPNRIHTPRFFRHLCLANRTMSVPIARQVVDRLLKMISVCPQ